MGINIQPRTMLQERAHKTVHQGQQECTTEGNTSLKKLRGDHLCCPGLTLGEVGIEPGSLMAKWAIEARRWHLMAKSYGATVTMITIKQPWRVNPQRLVKMVNRLSHPRR